MKELLALLANQGFSTEQGTFGNEKDYNAFLQQNEETWSPGGKNWEDFPGVTRKPYGQGPGAHENIDKIIDDEDTYHLIREILKAPDPKAEMPTNEEIDAMLKGSLNQGASRGIQGLQGPPQGGPRGFMPQNVPGSVRQPAPQGLQGIPQVGRTLGQGVGRPGMSSVPRQPKKDINTIIQEYINGIFAPPNVQEGRFKRKDMSSK